jgi:hypothetical protein
MRRLVAWGSWLAAQVSAVSEVAGISSHHHSVFFGLQ